MISGSSRMIDLDEVTLNKRQCLDFSYSHDKENFEVVAGSQHHRAQLVT